LTYAIETIDLTKKFPLRKRLIDFLPGQIKWLTALDRVNIRVEPGEIFGLVGPNGGGKTTLIKTLCTLLLPNGGKACVNGYDIERQSTEVRKNIGYFLDGDRSFYFRLTGRQNLAFFATMYNINGHQAKTKIEEVLHLLDISAYADRLFMEYSTGIRQRFSLARALLNDPLTLFLDEPTKSLDPQTAQSFREFLKERVTKGMGKTVFTATHSLEEAGYLCDRIAFLDRGEVKATGNFKEISKLFTKGC
jgi:ABC-2 type transport system ATP-binding protein